MTNDADRELLDDALSDTFMYDEDRRAVYAAGAKIRLAAERAERERIIERIKTQAAIEKEAVFAPDTHVVLEELADELQQTPDAKQQGNQK